MPVRPALRRLAAHAGRLGRDEDGSMVIHGLFTFATCCVIGSAALDVTHFFAARTQLQVAADLAAHAALYSRNQGTTSAAQARAKAIAAVEYGMPPEAYGDVISTADITFGTFDADERTFTVDDTARDAVLVTTERSAANANPVGSFLLRMVGVQQVDVSTQSLFTTYQPRCLNEGFVAQGVVDIQSNNAYYSGFCVHSNDHVELNQNNYFESGTVVSMPDLADLVTPSSGMDRNEGLEEALTTAYHDLRILDRIRSGASDPLQTAIMSMGSADTPSYLTSATAVALRTTTTSYAPSDFTAGRVNTRSCGTNGRITLTGGTYSNMVLYTNCPITMSGTVRLENVVVITNSTASDSIKTPSGQNNGLELGRPDSCAPGFGAQIITRGGFQAAAKLAVNGGQVLALGDVNFSAQATGLGASFIVGGGIDGTSNMSMTHCPTGLEDNFTVPYFHLAG